MAEGDLQFVYQVGIIDSAQAASVLDDCIDQLNILGSIMPKSFESRPNVQEFLADQISHVVDNQRAVEEKSLMGDSKNGKRDPKLGKDVRDGMHKYERGLSQNPLTPENLEKIKADREFCQHVLSSLANDLRTSGSFLALVDAVSAEGKRMSLLKEYIHKEEDLKKRIKGLQKQIIEVNRQKETELQQRAEYYAHLKDQLQETKAKTNMEEKYVKKLTDVNVAQTQHKCRLSEEELEEEKKLLTVRLEEEQRVNNEVENFLRVHEKDLEEKRDFWMSKYEKDVDAMQVKLDQLKSDKARDLDKLERMTRTYEEYEKVVLQDKIEKERARKKAEREAAEMRATLKIQSWWRTIMARRGIGLYAPKKKGKRGKGKKKK